MSDHSALPLKQSNPPGAENEDSAGIAPASLLATVMLMSVFSSAVLVALNYVYFLISNRQDILITLASCVSGVVASFAGWRLAVLGKTAIAAWLLIFTTSVGALAGVWISYFVFPLSLSLLTGGVLLGIPYLSTQAFRRSVYFSISVLLLVGIIYIFREPAATPLLLYARVSIFISCLIIVLLMSYLVFRSSGWMHSVVRESRRANTALREVQSGLEDTIQRRTAELTQANQQLTNEIAERRRAEAQLRDQNAFLETLHATSLDIVNRLNMHELLQSILVKASALLHVDDVFLDLIDQKMQMTHSVAGVGIFDVDEAREFVKGEGLVGTVWEKGDTVVVDDYATWERRSPNAVSSDIRAAVGVPLKVSGQTYGVICMVHKQPDCRFTNDEVALLERFANLASIACDNALLYETVRANEQALEARVAERTRELTAALHENDVLRAQAIKAAMAEERSRLARDLHDSVSQAIYGIVLGSRTLEQLAAGRAPAEPQLQKVVDYILSLADAALTEMRALIFELRPESLQQEGVLAAIRKQCDVLQVRYGLKIDLQTCDSEPAIPIEVKEAFYRIAIEATHNVVKHASATRIQVRFFPVGLNYQLQIADDGAGFDADAVAPGRLGLKTMRERAEKYGGSVTLHSQRGHGTDVCVDIPASIALTNIMDEG
jgi:signal transduction histidine kinase